MSTSGSYNYSVNRDQLIKDALIEVGAVAQEDTPSAAINEHAVRRLNLVLKALQPQGLRMWKTRRATLLLQKGTREYSLGPSGDNFAITSGFHNTTLSAAAAASATTLSLTSTSGITAADVIGVVLDSGNMHFTTVVVAATTTITTGLASAAASGNRVFTYTTKAQRPLSILDAWVRSSSNVDRPVRIVSRDEYDRYGDKFTAGSITSIYYDQQLTNGTLRLFNPESVVSNTLEMVVQYPIEDMDSAADDFDCPQEWLLAIQYQLSLNLCPSYGVRTEQFNKISALAQYWLDEAKGFDKENETSIQFSPDIRP